MSIERTILVLHGPNLSRLGKREPEIYGSLSLEELDERLRKHARSKGVDLDCFQSNSSGELIDRIESAEECLGLVLNPGGLTHYDVALRDAVAATDLPVVEVHLSTIHARESFRRRSLIAAVSVGQINGLGWRSYAAAIDFLVGEFGGGSALGFRPKDLRA